MDGIADGTLVAAPQPADGVSIAGKITVADARGAVGRRRPATSIGWSAPARRRRARGRRFAASGSSSVRCGCAARNDLRPGRAARRPRAASPSARRPPRSSSALVQPPGKRPMPAADWARGARIEAGRAPWLTVARARSPTGCCARRRVDGAYANLALPQLIAAAGLTGATRRWPPNSATAPSAPPARSTRSSPPASTARSPTSQPEVRDLLRLGAYQALRTRIPPHAAVATTVDLARATGTCAGGRVRQRGPAQGRPLELGRVDRAARPRRVAAAAGWRCSTAHPEWIAAAFADALDGAEARRDRARARRRRRAAADPPGRLARPHRTRRTARSRRRAPARGRRTRCGSTAATRAPSRACASAAPACRTRAASCARSPSRTRPIEGRDERWLDLCAGPGGKTALLAALAANAARS